jgi:hypothetical protein
VLTAKPPARHPFSDLSERAPPLIEARRPQLGRSSEDACTIPVGPQAWSSYRFNHNHNTTYQILLHLLNFARSCLVVTVRSSKRAFLDARDMPRVRPFAWLALLTIALPCGPDRSLRAVAPLDPSLPLPRAPRERSAARTWASERHERGPHPSLAASNVAS